MGLSSSGAELESSLGPLPGSVPNSAGNRTAGEVAGGGEAGWKREANRRLAAHRARRGSRIGLQAALPGMEENAGSAIDAVSSRSNSVADRVAARYAKAPSYSEMLAAEARAAARAAQAAAEAANQARAAAQAILVGLDAGLDAGQDEGVDRLAAAKPEASGSRTRDPRAAPQSQQSAAKESANSRGLRPATLEVVDEDEPFEQEPPSPIQQLPAKLLEFPRELVAARKARPRLAEGPLREEYDRAASQSQLRIFEVEAESISTEPAVEAVLPGWSSIRLESQEPLPADPASQPPRRASRSRSGQGQRAASGIDLPLQTASLEDRLMAAIVDAALVVAGFLVFVLVFAACTAHPPTGRPAEAGAAAALFAFALIYQALFFSFGQDTPGMRYAKIALCTFDDENPTRKAMRRRIFALLLAACPFGLGILWAFFDDDRLGWHDRISRTYQRSYR